MSSDNQFIYPGPGGDYGDYSSAILVQYGSPQEFNWTTSYDFGLDLVLWQETAETRIEKLVANTRATSYYWDGRPSQNLHLSDIFFLVMSPSSNSSQALFNSQYINVTIGATTPSPTTISSSSSFSSFTISTSPSPSLVTQPLTTPTSVASTTAPKSSSLVTQPITTPTGAAPTTAPKSKSNHVALGAGLGVGLGGAALLLTAVLLYCLSRGRRRKSGRSRPPEVYQLSGDSM